MKEIIATSSCEKEGEYGSVHVLSVFLLRRWARLQSEAGLDSERAKRMCN